MKKSISILLLLIFGFSSFFILGCANQGQNTLLSYMIIAVWQKNRKTYSTPAYSINGTINDNSGAPIENAQVNINLSGKQMSLTNSTGVFTITGVPNGTYIVTVSKNGYNISSLSVTINSTPLTNQNLSLSPANIQMNSVVDNAAFPERSEHTSVSHNNKLWIIGGNNGKNNNDVWHSEDGATWTLVTEKANFSARSAHSTVEFDGKIWVIGGNVDTNYTNSPPNKNNTTSSYTGTAVNDVWYSEDGINWISSNLNAKFPPRANHTSVIFQNKIWVIGGVSKGFLKNDVWYSTDGINWSAASENAEFSKRQGHSSIVYDNKIWIIGGNDGTDKNDVWYTEDGLTWKIATATAAFSARNNHTSLIRDNKMWVIGGSTGGSQLWYSTDGIFWATDDKEANFSERKEHASIVFNNEILVIGGKTPEGSYKNDVWAFNETYSVKGIIKDSSGNVLADAVVIIKSGETEKTRVTTGPDGSFEFTAIFSADYTLTASKTLYNTNTISITVASENSENNEIILSLSDSANPGVTISSTVSGTTLMSPIPFSVVFTETVTGFELSDITVTNGTASTLASADNTTFTFNVTPAAAGDVTVNIAADKAADSAGNNNTVSNTITITYDNVSPSVTLATTATNPTSTSPISCSAVFSKAVTGFGLNDITVTNGTASTLASADNITFTFNVTPAAAGDVTVNIAADKAADSAGNNNTVSNTITITYDNVSPSVTLATTASNSTNTSPIPFSAVFSKAVTGFELSDIAVANGTAASLASTDNTTFTFNVTPAAAGDVTVNIAADKAADSAGNKNTASNQLTIIYDNINPQVVLTDNHADNLVRDADTVIITATFTETDQINEIIVPKIKIGSIITNISMTKISNLIWTYTWNVPAGNNGAQAISISATDRAGNNNNAATGQTSLIIDNIAPTDQNTVLNSDPVCLASATINITASSDAENSIWIAPSGTTTFTEGSTITKAAGNATTITAPATGGTYKLFVVDKAGNISNETTANITVATAVYKLEDLAAIGNSTDTLSKTYKLMNNIDFNDDASYTDTGNKATWTAGTGWVPIGTSSNAFTGKFYGNNKTISNLFINRPAEGCIGFFGNIEGEVNNLGLVNINITANGGDIGGLTGKTNNATITNSYSTGTVNATGGLYVSGFIGKAYNSSITNCYSTVSVSTTSSYVGGLIGNLSSGNNLTASYSTGSVSGNDHVGGLTGINYSTITNCYSTGSVTSNGQYAGGLTSGNNGTITKCYSTGAVSGTGNIGGLSGYGNEANISSCFWDTDTSSQGTSDGGTGKTTVLMKQQATFTDWDFVNIWQINEGVTYPTLR